MHQTYSEYWNELKSRCETYIWLMGDKIMWQKVLTANLVWTLRDICFFCFPIRENSAKSQWQRINFKPSHSSRLYVGRDLHVANPWWEQLGALKVHWLDRREVPTVKWKSQWKGRSEERNTWALGSSNTEIEDEQSWNLGVSCHIKTRMLLLSNHYFISLLERLVSH